MKLMYAKVNLNEEVNSLLISIIFKRFWMK